MFPLLPFAVGSLTGAVAVKLVRNEKAKKQLVKAQEMLREATVSSLDLGGLEWVQTKPELLHAIDHQPQSHTGSLRRADLPPPAAEASVVNAHLQQVETHPNP